MSISSIESKFHFLIGIWSRQYFLTCIWRNMHWNKSCHQPRILVWGSWYICIRICLCVWFSLSFDKQICKKQPLESFISIWRARILTFENQCWQKNFLCLCQWSFVLIDARKHIINKILHILVYKLFSGCNIFIHHIVVPEV